MNRLDELWIIAVNEAYNVWHNYSAYGSIMQRQRR